MSNFFKSDEERNLWIKLNAERIQYNSKVRLGVDRELGTIKDPTSAMFQSNNQLTYDEMTQPELRFTLEELLLPEEDLYYLAKNRSERLMWETMGQTEDTNPELFEEH